LHPDQQRDLAILRAETKVGVPTLPLAKNSESIAVNAWRWSLQFAPTQEQPVAPAPSLPSDRSKKRRFQIVDRFRTTLPARRLSMRGAKL